MHRDPVKRLNLEKLDTLLSSNSLWEDETPTAPCSNGTTTTLPSINERCQLSRVVRTILDEIRDGTMREAMLNKEAKRPTWLESCREWWLEYPSTDQLRRRNIRRR